MSDPDGSEVPEPFKESFDELVERLRLTPMTKMQRDIFEDLLRGSERIDIGMRRLDKMIRRHLEQETQ